MSINEYRELVRDYLNGNLKENELLLNFEIKKCPECDEYELEEDLIDTEEKLNGSIDYICSQCCEDRNIK
jgi:hypothetical protein